MDTKNRFQREFPDRFFMENDLGKMEGYLRSQAWIGTEENLLSLEKPGEGNMNFVLRAKTSKGSLIVKQARSWVEKYPQIDAPIERIEVEAAIFSAIGKVPGMQAYSPKIIGFDKQNGIMAVEDLGSGGDYSFLYQKGEILSQEEVDSLANFISGLHDGDTQDIPGNLAMRKLNHEHIFHFPYLEENGFDLDTVEPGLQHAAMPYKKDEVLKGKISQLGDLYLSPGTALLHGDFYPGSWLKTNKGIKIIDPEFGFVGPPEFELGVILAHMLLAEQGDETARSIYSSYKKAQELDHSLLAGFAGTEVLRRLIGIAQLPLALDLAAKQASMSRARNWILVGKLDYL